MKRPANWTEDRLGEVCSIEIGGTPSRRIPEYWDAERATQNTWVSIRDMHQRIIFDTAEHISDAGVKHSNTKLQQKGTVLLSFKLTIGRVAMAGVPLYTNEAIAGLKPIKDLKSEYLYHGLQYWDLLQDVDQAIKGATLNKEKLKRITFLFPELSSEQTKIAEILLTVDQAIDQTEALIAKQQRIKTGLMQDLLMRGIDENGNLRSEDTHEFKDSPFGRIPVEWIVLTIDDIARYVGSGVTPRGGKSIYTTDGVLFIRSQDVHFGKLLIDNIVHIPERIHLSMQRSEVYEHDVLLNITGASIGRCCRIPRITGRANVNQHVCTIRLYDVTEAMAGVMAAILESSIGQNQIARLNAGGNREGLNYQQVRSFLIPWPRSQESNRLYRIIEMAADQVHASHSSLEKLRALKTALMQDLLTGHVSVTPLLTGEDFRE